MEVVGDEWDLHRSMTKFNFSDYVVGMLGELR